MSAAIAEGTQENHEMLTWLHGVQELEVINPGYNSSYIELPADVCVQSLEERQIELY